MANESTGEQKYDAIIVGGSIAGCVTALELAKQGARIALVEKRANLEHYKKICSHIIHPSGVRTLKKLGVMEQMEKNSAQPTYMEINSQGKAVYFPFAKKTSAANIERKDIDPALKHAINSQTNISAYWGHSVSSLIKDAYRVAGIRCKNNHGQEISLRAKLVIGADGRSSILANLDQADSKIIDNERAAIFSYFEPMTNLTESKVWTNDKGNSYIGCFPNRKHLLITWYIPSSRLTNILKNKERAFEQEVIKFVREKGLTVGKQTEPLIVAKDTSTSIRRTRSKGLVLIGDARLAADPLTGVGCSWAMSSGKMLSLYTGKILSQPKFSWREQLKLDLSIMFYELSHALRYNLPARLMAVISKKGEWAFSPVIFSIFSKISRINFRPVKKS